VAAPDPGTGMRSTEPERRDETISAYGTECELETALPEALVQALLS
jgi:hypothetical protein